MNLRLKKYHHNVLISIDSINEYLGEDKSFFVYQQNKLLRRAAEREIEIIGEAKAQVLQIDRSLPIRNARKVVNTRNWVIHSYDKVDDVIIWAIVSNHLTELKEDVEKIMNT